MLIFLAWKAEVCPTSYYQFVYYTNASLCLAYPFSYLLLSVCAVTGIRYLIEGVIRFPIIANAKPFFAGDGNALHRRVNAIGKKAYERRAVN